MSDRTAKQSVAAAMEGLIGDWIRRKESVPLVLDDCTHPSPERSSVLMLQEPMTVPISTCLPLLAMLPVLLMLVARARPTSTPLAMAAAGVVPCCLVHPLLGMYASVALNLVLLLEVHTLELTGTGKEPASSSAAEPQRAKPSAPQASPPDPPVTPKGRRQSRSAQPVPVLNAMEVKTLESGETVLKRILKPDGSQEGLAVQRMNAPAELVWATLLDFNHWDQMVDNVLSTEVYEQSGADIKVLVVVGVGFIKLRSHVHHVLDRTAGQLTWTLDVSRPSDLVANSGFWLIRESADDSRTCTVYYSTKIATKAWAPAWLDSFLAQQGLPRAVAWLKRESEKRAKASSGRLSHRRTSSAPHLPELATIREAARRATANEEAGAAASAWNPAPSNSSATETSAGVRAASRAQDARASPAMPQEHAIARSFSTPVSTSLLPPAGSGLASLSRLPPTMSADDFFNSKARRPS